MRTVFSATYSGEICMELLSEDGRMLDSLLLKPQRLWWDDPCWSAKAWQQKAHEFMDGGRG
jgi:hypothetical protein